MKTFSPLQWHNLAKSFTVSFILLTLVWSLVSFPILGHIYVSWYLFAGNLFLSSILSWFYYRYRFHTVFSYDQDRFEMVRGRLKTRGRWEEFGSVSLVHLGGGRFVARLYREEGAKGDSVDIPASDLGLDPSKFRFEVMIKVMGSKLKT